MFPHILTMVLLVVPLDGVSDLARPSHDAEKLTEIRVDDVTLRGRTVSFKSAGGVRTCEIEGRATMSFGDIDIRAERIHYIRSQDLESLICLGRCRWEQDDGSGRVFSCDRLEFQKDGLRFSGNASVQYGSGEHKTVITCDSITAKYGEPGHQLSGRVRLLQGEQP